MEKCAIAIIRYGAKIVVIDPWNEMDHIRPPGMTLTEYTGFAIKQFKRLANKYQVHVIVCAHPTKQRKSDDGAYAVPTLYDISDSAHWFNKADVGIVVHRTGDHETLIRVLKVRDQHEVGTPGEIIAEFNRYTCRYTVQEDRLKAAAE